MPGLFGNYPIISDGPGTGGLAGNQGGGILGASAAPQYTTGDKISLIGSLLQDAYAGYWGRPGGNVNKAITEADNRNIQSRLISDLQSTDPATRQKAYMFAQMKGIDTKPFQQQQATQQLPDLLKSMQPTQQTLQAPAASADVTLPAVGGLPAMPSKLNIPAGPNLGTFQQPGLSMRDALMNAPPELQSQYAPKLLDLQMTADAKANEPYDLSPGQVRFQGGQQVASLPEKNNPNQPFNVDGSPNRAFQDYTSKLKRLEQGPAWAALAEKKRADDAANPMLGAGMATDITKYPPQVQSMVKAMVEGRQAPPSSFALSKPYWQNMIALANATDPTFDQTAWGARASARKDMLGGGKSYQLLNSGNTAIQHLGRLHSQIGDVAGMQIPLVGNMVNSGINAAEQASGIPGVNAYNDTLGHLAEETTKFYRGTGGNEEDVKRNMSNLSANLSTPTKQAGVANTVHLIYGALQPKVEQYNKTMGTNFPVSHFLSSKSIQVVKKMGFDPDTGETVSTPSGAGGWSNFKVHN